MVEAAEFDDCNNHDYKNDEFNRQHAVEFTHEILPFLLLDYIIKPFDDNDRSD
jgi:hypothetical protein